MKTRTGWLKVVAGIMLMVGFAVAEEAKVEAPAVAANTDLPVLSAYVWRGQVLNDEAVFQPALNLTKGGLGLNVWGNFNLTDSVTEDPDFSEIDLTLSYGGKAGVVGYGVGLIEYLFPNSTLATDEGGVGYPGTRELYASLSLPELPVIPALSVYRDIDEADGTYAAVSVAYSQSLVAKLTLGLSASLGMADADYNSFYFGVDESALNDANVGATLSYALLDTLTVVPGVQYTWLPDSDIEDGAAGLYKDKEALTGSLKINYVF
jgi:hypothetical protein